MYMNNLILSEESSVTRGRATERREGSVVKNGRRRVSDEEFRIAQIGEHETVVSKNYNVRQLKDMCRWHKLKISGTKGELLRRLYEYLRQSLYALRIQRAWRVRLCRLCNKLRGAGYLKRENCVNETDFFSMEKLSEVAPRQFVSYTCPHDRKVYGFDIESLYKLLAKGGVCNPYTREPFPITMNRDINRLIRLSAVTGQRIYFSPPEEDQLTPEKRLELGVVGLFQSIDALGNITNHLWFWNLGRVQLIRFIRELADIWGYRAQLQDAVKREICPPDGNPFRGVDLPGLPTRSHCGLRRIALEIMEAIVKRGVNSGAKSLGANYVLCALTLVSSEAANALPWLYDAVVST